MKTNNNNNVVIIKKNNFNDHNNYSENNPDENNFNEENQNQNIEQEKQLLDIKMQTKIFSVLLMAFSILLFLALISHTSKDEPNTQFRFTELFGIFSGDPSIKIKFDTSINLLGLLGAYISDVIINGTIGIAIIGLPIFLFIWGYKLFKVGEIADNIVKNTNKYLIFSVVFACILGSLSNFSALQNIPIEFYGAIGAFIGAMVSKTISPIGSTILFLLLFSFLILKFTTILKIIRERRVILTIKNMIEKIKIDNIVAKINSYLSKNEKITSPPTTFVPSKNAPKNATVTASTNFSNDSFNDRKFNSEKVFNSERKNNDFNSTVSTPKNIFTNENITNKSTVPNIFYENKNPINEISNEPILHPIKQNQNRDIIDDEAFSKSFKGKIKLKSFSDDFFDDDFDNEKKFNSEENFHSEKSFSTNIQNIEIREIERNELHILEETFLYEATFQIEGSEPYPREIIYKPEIYVYIENFGSMRDDYCLVAEVHNKIIGAVWVRILAGKIRGYGNIDAQTPEFAISILKEFRRQGVGTLLMQKMLEHLKNKGYSQLSLSVHKTNYAVKMYQKLGFEIIKENINDYIMVLKFGDENTNSENLHCHPELVSGSHQGILKQVQYDEKNPTIIEEAVFTFQPPENIELPKQTIYVPEENVNPDLQNSKLDIEDYINENQPIKLDFAKIDKEKAEQERKEKLLIEVDKSEDDIRKMKIQREEKIRSGLRNPLGVGIHDENLKNYQNPKLDLLDVGAKENFANDEELQQKGRILQEKLQTFKIDISNLEVTRGPVVTQYEFVPADGVKISKIEGLADDLSMALKAKSVHIIAPVPGKGTVGIQIPNSNPSIVRFRSVIAAPQFAHSKFELPLALGKTVSGEPFVADLAKMPHLLIAGSTGSGKSVGINTIISSLLYKKHPSQLKFVVIDPKKVELTQYASLSNHFLAVSPDLQTEIVTEPQDAITILKAAVLEMEKRYTLLEIAKQRNIKDYNEKIREGAFKNDVMIDHRELPYIVVIVDELADLMLTAGKEVELPIVRLAQMARAVGIHLIIATQRPSVNVITGIIKANFPARIAYLTAQKVDSRTILDASGAEALLGNGDMLYSSANQPKPIRMQNPFISTDEVERICEFIGEQEGYSAPYMLPSTYESGNEGDFDASEFDPLFKEAAELIIDQQQASTSMLQRRLKIGFARAGRIMDELTAAGVVGPPQGSKPRTILMESISDLDRVLGGQQPIGC